MELPPGLEHLASTLRFKLHQALVALGPPGRDGGCHVRLSVGSGMQELKCSIGNTTRQLVE